MPECPTCGGTVSEEDTECLLCGAVLSPQKATSKVEAEELATEIDEAELGLDVEDEAEDMGSEPLGEDISAEDEAKALAGLLEDDDEDEEDDEPKPDMDIVAALEKQAADAMPEVAVVEKQAEEPASVSASEETIPEKKEEEEHKCDTCSGPLRYIDSYKRWYCDKCKKYAPKQEKEEPISELKPEPVAEPGAEPEPEPKPEPEPAPKEPEKAPANACDTCGKPLRYIDSYKRWYCDSCKKYAPREEESKPEAKPEPAAEPRPEPKPEPKPEPAPVMPEKAPANACGKCGKPLRYIDSYKRWYCDSCKEYAPTTEKEKPPEPKPEPAPEPKPETKPVQAPAAPARAPAHACSKCGKPLRYIDSYKRWYCDSCKTYAPGERKAAAPQPRPEPRPEPRPQAPPARAAPATAPAAPAKGPSYPCKTCGKPLRYIKEYKRWYCDGCGKYAPAPRTQETQPMRAPPQQQRPASAPSYRPPAAAARPQGAPAARSRHNCPHCWKPMEYIPKYNRWYCHNCKRYADRQAPQGQTARQRPSPGPTLPQNNCPTCRKPLNYVSKHNKWYCYTCKRFVDPRPIISKKKPPEPAKPKPEVTVVSIEEKKKRPKEEPKVEAREEEPTSKEEKEEEPDKGPDLEPLEMGNNYLLFEAKPNFAFKQYAELITEEEETNALCITTTFPQKVRRKHNLEDAQIMWLSETTSDEETVNPKRLDFEVTRIITHYFKDLQNSIVMLDGLEYLILENGFGKVIKFVKKINDISSLTGSTFIVVLNRESLKVDELTLLQREFDMSLDYSE